MIVVLIFNDFSLLFPFLYSKKHRELISQCNVPKLPYSANLSWKNEEMRWAAHFSLCNITSLYSLVTWIFLFLFSIEKHWEISAICQITIDSAANPYCKTKKWGRLLTLLSVIFLSVIYNAFNSIANTRISLLFSAPISESFCECLPWSKISRPPSLKPEKKKGRGLRGTVLGEPLKRIEHSGKGRGLRGTVGSPKKRKGRGLRGTVCSPYAWVSLVERQQYWYPW